MKTLGTILLVLIAAAAIVGGAQARDGEITIAGGQIGKTYQDIYAVNLGSLLKQYHVRYRATGGSEENLDLLAAKQTDIGFAQADLYAGRLRADRKRYDGITVLGLLSDECVFVAHRKDGPVSSWESLQHPIDGRAPKVAVGSPHGGSNGTWKFITALQPALEKVEVEATGGSLSLNQLAIGMLDAVLWVTDPSNPRHTMLQGIQANEDLELLPITDSGLEYTLDNGTRVYRIETIEIGVQPHQTICTNALVLARPDAPSRLVEGVSDLISLRRDDLVRMDASKRHSDEGAFPVR